MLERPAPSGPVTMRIPNGGKLAGIRSRPHAWPKDRLLPDQVPNYPAVSEHARDRRVLDCFTGQGGFALACAQAGAAEVTGVEGSGESLATARANADGNGLGISWIEQDVFQFLRSSEKAKSEYDLIILDPPSFTRTKGNSARRSARISRIAPARLQTPFEKRHACHLFLLASRQRSRSFRRPSPTLLVDARRSARRLRRFEQALDHPVMPTIPETEYFKGFLLEMMPGR